MPLLPRRFKKLKSILNRRISDLTILVEQVEKPHNLSAIMRTCDAAGVLEAHAVARETKTRTFNSTAQGSQKWVPLKDHKNIEAAALFLKKQGFKLYGTNLSVDAIDYRYCDYTGPTAFVLGAEKWGLSEPATRLMDAAIYIPMRGMVQSLNVSVAASALLFEALRQREVSGTLPQNGEGLPNEIYEKILFEWCYPEVANWCNQEGRQYPKLNSEGEILEHIPRAIKVRC
ncbi:tRNA (guanosine(18)-2'-O)-methyltransferase TrmH [Prochlorococcus marinus]|uniref:tRNA (guanosine(18)-2'-O)-methyltransferase n=1 Tax=Prochlorococcus marinus (strain MIT 9211) TaxID=93059 RepID=A9BE42_PROM4|nr:tRNA (guanosine(18)-2'-O)-methyltransferase TrmH [Prochlorococcus marinus]ABX08352.1 tRNA/rRNA methyltransferase (SpoU) [Prochlorococcus marinus str. MIT 9211]